MHMHPYVYEKLREIDEELAARATRPERLKKGVVFGPLVRGTGRTLRRLGEGLESWAGAGAIDADQPGMELDRRAG